MLSTQGLLPGKPVALRGVGSFITLDFGREVGGFVRVRFGARSDAAQRAGLTFSESALYAGPDASDFSNGGSDDEPPLEYTANPGQTLDTERDQAVGGAPPPSVLVETVRAGDNHVTVRSSMGIASGSMVEIGSGPNIETATIKAMGSAGSTAGTRTLLLEHGLLRAHANSEGVAVSPNSSLRGGFRYLTIVNRSGGKIVIDNVKVQITFAPQMKDLRKYANYFVSNDNLLNRIWYAGAYTVQTNMISSGQGRIWLPPTRGWSNSGRVGEGGPVVLVDGAKRDRTVWPGDLGMSIPVLYTSIGDMAVARTSLQTLYNHQSASGALPYVGPVVNSRAPSETYQMWSLIATAAYIQFTQDMPWLQTIWPRYKAGIAFILDRIGTDHLLNVASASDWGRTNPGGKQIEAQAILYHTLRGCAALAKPMADPALGQECEQTASDLKAAVAAGGYWDPAAGLYRNLPEGPTATLYPQDGNALAAWFGLIDSAEKAQTISRGLAARWTQVGALTPERGPRAVHPFAGAMEVFAHFAAGADNAALDLIRREWGYMLLAPQGTASTFWEGYRTDGSSDYNGSYESMSHAWSAGPTAALTFFVLGIRPDPAGSATYSFVPHPGSLRRVEGQLVTPKGPITVSWRADASTGKFWASYRAPRGALSSLAVPALSHMARLCIDGHTVSNAKTQGNYLYADAPPGRHIVKVCQASN